MIGLSLDGCREGAFELENVHKSDSDQAEVFLVVDHHISAFIQDLRVRPMYAVSRHLRSINAISLPCGCCLRR